MMDSAAQQAPSKEQRRDGAAPDEPVHVGVVVSSSSTSTEHLEAFAKKLIERTRPPLQAETQRKWQFHIGEPMAADTDEKRRPADFIAQASLRLTEGSLDLIVIVTDAPLLSSGNHIVTAVASPLTRIGILSSRQLRKDGRGPDLPLTDGDVLERGESALLRLIAEAVGGHGASGRIHGLAGRLIEREYCVDTVMDSFWAHVRSAFAHPGLLLRALVRNRAPLLPLSLPGLATAAIAPIFLLVFTAEFWDAGLGLSNMTAAIFAALSIFGATLYLTFGQKLFLPRKVNVRLPQHLALANDVIFTTILLAEIGLFVMVALLTLAIELWVFPPDLIETWPTLADPNVDIVDKLRLASFISTIGVITGSLAGGLERSKVMRHLALFQTEMP